MVTVDGVAECMHTLMVLLKPVIWVMDVIVRAIESAILVFCCVCCTGKYIKRLALLFIRLDMRKREVDELVKKARDAGQAISEGVESWVDEVHEIIGESRTLLEEYISTTMRATRTAAGRSGSGWMGMTLQVLVERRNTGEQAVEMLNKIKGILDKAPRDVTAEMDEWLVKERGNVAEQILEDLQDENVRIVGVYGEAGIGKTTFVNKLLEEARKRCLFNTIAKAVVSEIVDVERIQEEIARGIGFSFGPGDHDDQIRIRSGGISSVANSFSAGTGQESRGTMMIHNRALKLHKRLENIEVQEMKRVLIYLDNICCSTSSSTTKLQLDDLCTSVGIPVRCKIVLSTISRDSCEQMGATKLHTLQCLNGYVQWKLFRKLLRPPQETYSKDDVTTLVNCCRGLPLAICTLAKAYENHLQEHRSAGGEPRKWARSVDKQWCRRESKDQMNGLVSAVLKLGCNSVASKDIKSFFRLCCLFPGDSAIGVEELVRYGIGLSLFTNKDNELQHSIAQGTEWAKRLQALNLLKDAEFSGSHGLAVRMHDSFCRAAISPESKEVTREEFRVMIDGGWEKWTEKPETLAKMYAISVKLCSRGFQKLPGKLKCCELRILRLECCSFKNNFYFSSSDCFDEMGKLQVLIMKKVYFCKQPLPSLGSLKNLRTLCLDGCTGVDVLLIRSTITQLTSLEILSLRGSDISKVPEGLKQLTHLKVLDLTSCKELKIIPRNVINSLAPSLQGLYMLGSFIEWNTGDDVASLQELESLSQLKVLQLEIKVEHLPIQLPFINETFCFAIKTTADCNSLFLNQFIKDHGLTHCCYGSQRKLLELQNLTITYPDDTSTKMKPLSDLLKATEELRMYEVRGITSITNLSTSETWTKLTIDSCNDLESVFTHTTEQQALSNLDHLELRSLSRVNNIYPANHIVPQTSLSKLKVLHIHDCQQLKCLPVGSEGQFPKALESLGIWYCRSLERIFAKEEREVEEEDNANIHLPNLHCLKIFGAHNLKSFSSLPLEESQPFFAKKDLLPAIKTLAIARVQLKKIWDSNMPANSFARLEALKLSSCSSIKKVVPFSQLSRLNELKKLDISYCDELEEIFGSRSTLDGSVPLSIPLRELILKNLSRLTRINLTYYKVEWLCFVSVGGCPFLEFVFSAQSAKSLVKLKHLHITECKELQVVVGGGVEIDEDVELPQLRQIRLCSLGSLQSFCSRSCRLKLPKLQLLEIIDCPVLQRFSYKPMAMVTPMLPHVKLSSGKQIWNGELNTTIQQLRRKAAGDDGEPKISAKEEAEIEAEIETAEKTLLDFMAELDKLDSGRLIHSDPEDHERFLNKVHELLSKIKPLEEKKYTSKSLRNRIKLAIRRLETIRSLISS